jgi:hypothetical protein
VSLTTTSFVIARIDYQPTEACLNLVCPPIFNRPSPQAPPWPSMRSGRYYQSMRAEHIERERGHRAKHNHRGGLSDSLGVARGGSSGLPARGPSLIGHDGSPRVRQFLARVQGPRPIRASPWTGHLVTRFMVRLLLLDYIFPLLHVASFRVGNRSLELVWALRCHTRF